MTSAVTVSRAGEAVFDPDSASYAPPTETELFSGPALVRPLRSTVDATGRTSIVVDTWEVKLPVDSALEIGDAVEVTASAYDPGLVGLQLRVSGVAYDEWQIARVATAVAQRDRPA